MRRLLLDTHAALFWWAGAAKLGKNAHEAMLDADVAILISAASCWEIATKFRIGKLDFAGDPVVLVPRLIAQNDFEILEVGADHALFAGSLPGQHKDPFDRLLAAQAMIEDLTVITRDREIAKFGCKVLW